MAMRMAHSILSVEELAFKHCRLEPTFDYDSPGMHESGLVVLSKEKASRKVFENLHCSIQTGPTVFNKTSGL
jgi:hypothetical protein